MSTPITELQIKESVISHEILISEEQFIELLRAAGLIPKSARPKISMGEHDLSESEMVITWTTKLDIERVRLDAITRAVVR